jgi:hypothetical protein
MTHKSKWYAVNTGALAYGLFNLPKRLGPVLPLSIWLLHGHEHSPIALPFRDPANNPISHVGPRLESHNAPGQIRQGRRAEDFVSVTLLLPSPRPVPLLLSQ